MPLSPTQRIIGVVAIAVAAVLAATLSVRSYVAGDAKDLRQREVAPETFRALEAATERLLAIAADELPARLREAISPSARPEALGALVAMLETMREAKRCKLAAADGYGPKLIKAIYDLTEADGRTRRIALMFERSKDGVVLLDVSL